MGGIEAHLAPVGKLPHRWDLEQNQATLPIAGSPLITVTGLFGCPLSIIDRASFSVVGLDRCPTNSSGRAHVVSPGKAGTACQRKARTAMRGSTAPRRNDYRPPRFPTRRPCWVGRDQKMRTPTFLQTPAARSSHRQNPTRDSLGATTGGIDHVSQTENEAHAPSSRHDPRPHNGGGIEAKYILDITDLEAEMMTTLRRIRDRDGAKVLMQGAA
jgi:hypothetical protein